jgi:hypothetical protein
VRDAYNPHKVPPSRRFSATRFICRGYASGKAGRFPARHDKRYSFQRQGRALSARQINATRYSFVSKAGVCATAQRVTLGDSILKITFSPEGELNLVNDEGWGEVLRQAFGNFSQDAALDYRTAHVLASYPDIADQMIRASFSTCEVIAPYIIIVDYRSRAYSSLGSFILAGKYILPPALAKAGDAEIQRRSSLGQLFKENSPAVRLADVAITSAHHVEMVLQEATYFDQIATNLSADVKLLDSTSEDSAPELTIREWDKHQSNCLNSLPLLKESRLANTIGVAIGIRTYDEQNRPCFVTRKRQMSVAVYANMWHVPISFALSNRAPLPIAGRLDDLVSDDFFVELYEELGVTQGEIKTIRALALCRDLVRAGKPQLFLDVELAPSFEELSKRMRIAGTDEFHGGPILSRIGDTQSFPTGDGSPELQAYICLCSQDSQGMTR